MGKRRVLVTAISGDLGNGILKCLLDAGDDLYGCDICEYPAGIDKVIKFKRVISATSLGYIEEIMALCKEWRITHIIPANESEMIELSVNRNVFEKIGISIVINAKNILDIFMNKYKTEVFLSAIDGISVPRTTLLCDYDGSFDKIVVKPILSHGSDMVWMGNSIEDFVMPKSYNEREMVVQEYIEGEEYTVGVFSDGVKIKTIIFRRKLKNGY